jgi:hypothetical protein
MSKLQEISGELIEISSISPDLRNNALSDLAKKIQGLDDYDIIPEQKSLIVSIIESLISENDAEQIAKSKLVFVKDVEEQIAPTKKTRAKKVVKPVTESTLEDLPDDIGQFPILSTLPEPIIRLAGLRRKEQGKTEIVSIGETLSNLFDWNITPEGTEFWYKISNDGDLTEFKKLYGNKGEKVDEIIEFSELTEFVEGLSKNQTELPDTIQKQPQIKDLPDAVKKLALFRQSEQNLMLQSDVFLASSLAFDWTKTPEEWQFWNLINDGDLRNFKRIYGDKGEYVDRVIDGLVGFNELVDLAIAKSKTPAPAPVVKTRKPRTPKAPAPIVAPVVKTEEVNSVEIIFYPPSGGIININCDNLYELHDTARYIMKNTQPKPKYLDFRAITSEASYGITFFKNITNDQDVFYDKLKGKLFDIWGKKTLFDWNEFNERIADIDKIKLNEEIINDALKKDSMEASVEVEKPKPVAKAKTTSVKPETKITSVKPEAKTKQKQVTKPKAKSDLSFLDDLDNIL